MLVVFVRSGGQSEERDNMKGKKMTAVANSRQGKMLEVG